MFAAQGADEVRDLDVLLAESDIVSLHARVTPETRGFIGEPEFRRMKHGAYFINTARGPMVDYDALDRARPTAIWQERGWRLLRRNLPARLAAS